MPVIRSAFLLLFVFAWSGLTAPAAAEPDDSTATEAKPKTEEASGRTAEEEAELQREYEKALRDVLRREDDLVRAIEKIRTYSVTVRNLVNHNGTMRLRGMGSGVIVQKGSTRYVITNTHVTDGNQGLEVVTYDGETHTVAIQDEVKSYDITLLRFTEKVRYRGIRIDPNVSERRVREGKWVIATGNPFGLALDGRSVVTLGVISGLDRYLGGKYQYVGAIQHDTEVNPGNSGGPLWDLDGKFVGINGKIAMGQPMQGAGPTNSGASFSLPAHQVDAFLNLLTRDKSDAKAGYLGIEAETFTDERGQPAGARITKIERRSPAMARGSKNPPAVGDVITRLRFFGVSSTRIYTATDLRRELSLVSAGTRFQITYKRDRRTYRCKGTLSGR